MLLSPYDQLGRAPNLRRRLEVEQKYMVRPASPEEDAGLGCCLWWECGDAKMANAVEAAMKVRVVVAL